MEFKVVGFEPNPNRISSLIGFVTILILDLDMRISGIRYHKRDRTDWVQLPCRRLLGERGEVQWVPNVSFSNPQVHHDFLEELADKVSEYRKEWPNG